MMKCPHEHCQIELDSPAETFLHRELHREPSEGLPRDYKNLRTLPYILMPRVARLMHDYHEFMMRREAGEEQLEGWPCSAGFAPRLPTYDSGDSAT